MTEGDGIQTGLLLEGDATGNNVVNISDFSLLAANFLQIGDGGVYP